ncbi:2-oxo acid dehydrogenase subunit E2 [Alkanindiges illinoisensis]|uniref:Dihydrolipoamide acetyltransferase component of pyruvate dehydrogenase complex n=1 Tax=Alkanindiges illinoisensis TaxID=197183 RepID=A0A4Y7XBX8_9GAMM|nr:2-oxo acid dehydrogenase subunit E2 [Alkanindiges illinoisensis]TEU26846.1 biotin/lipoyl-binding protein [Alkanindiges illinoisensis]
MEIKAPDLGVDSADVSEILVKVGDSIEKEQSLLVLESAKASVEVPSPASGVIKAIAIRQGQSVKQGDVLFELEGDTAEQPAPNENSNVDESDQVAPAQQMATEQDESASESGIKDVKVPDLGVDEADVSEILVRVGDSIAKDQSLIVLESAKASVEVPSPVSGTVKEIKLKTGQKVKQGMVILSLEHSEANATANNPEPDAKTQQQTAQPDAPVTQLQNSTQASAYPQESIQLGNPTHTPAQDQVQGQSLNAEQIKANSEVYAGPAVRQLARQLGVVLAQVTPSGANQRILKEDVFAFVKQTLGTDKVATSGQHAVLASNGLPALPDFEKFGGSTLQPMSRLQQVSVPQLSLNNYIPQVTQFDQADITELENWRNTLKADYRKQNISLTILAFIVKAVAYLLKKESYFNSHLADDQKAIVVRNEIHLGIAVATQDGLTVPVLRNPDTLSIQDIAIQLGKLSQKARDKKLKPQELQGASFTITSLGSIGGTAFTPLVNWPQVAILGISPASMQPVWSGQDFKPRLMLPLSLSYDHRVINGADAARFTHALSEILSDIRRVLL